MEKNPLSSISGFKKLFPPPEKGFQGLHIGGVGVREIMPPGFVERARGSGDYFMALFHDDAASGTTPSPALHGAPDRLVIWPPGQSQFYGHPSSRFCHSWLHCQGARIARIVRRTGLPLCRPIAMPDSPRFQQMLLDLHEELSAYAPAEPTILGNLLENGLLHLSRSLGQGASVRIPERLLAVRRLIGSAPARPVSLGEMAAMAGMSAPHFCTVFKKTFGLAPKECLIYHRLHHAARLLADRQLTISEAAIRAGYPDLFHFSKMFKKHFGVGPREMRDRSKSAHPANACSPQKT